VSDFMTGELHGGPDPFGADVMVTGLGTVPTGANDRLLLAEDNEVNQRITVAMLESLGYCVDVVEDGVEAVTAAALVPYRAILMDCQIPVLNGYEATVEIRTHEGASRHSPIIAVTSAITDADRRHCLHVGMNGLVGKPVSRQSLADGMARFAPDASLSTGPAEPETLPPTAITTTGGRPAAERPRPALHRHGSDGDGPDRLVLDGQVLDGQVLESLRDLGLASGEDLVGEMTVLFLRDADTKMGNLRHALAGEDGPGLILSAHTLCGASANMGATVLSQLYGRLVTVATAGDFESGRRLLPSVDEELGRVRDALVMACPSSSPDESPALPRIFPHRVTERSVPVPAASA
jgi:two-component system, sensor histidine kinase and response regulator